MHQALRLDGGTHVLGGRLWRPERDRPYVVILMHPGAGPSDRHNDVSLPPSRAHLLAGLRTLHEAGCASLVITEARHTRGGGP